MFKAKFKVITKKEFEGGNVEVVMNATDKGDFGDFTKYTPSGTLTFICTNPVVNEQIKPGKVFTMLFMDDEEVAAEQEAQTDSN